MDLLVHLAGQPEKVISKEELMEAVWGGAIVEEGALSQAVHSLRKILGDDARQPRYIQTIPKRGYRLMAPVLPGTLLEPPGIGERPPAGSLGTVDPPSDPPPRPWYHRRWLWSAVTLLAAVSCVFWIAEERRQSPRSPERAGAPAGAGNRIVILPFENLGKPEDAFFADGLTEEITKDLASFASLQVISRTSAVRVARTGKTLPEIGRELGVDYVLEGTVRWAVDTDGRRRVRITPQLIRVADDAHVWADAFTSDVKDIFLVQTEISRRVITQLGITLLPQEKRLPRPPPTGDLAAYEAYLRGLDLKNQPFYSEPHLRQAVPMFERAVRLDPGFARAWAALSMTHTYLAYNSDPSPAQVERARQALDRAEALAPELPEVKVARAYFTYLCEEDFKTAQEQLEAAARISPNNAELLQTLGFVLRRRGQLTRGIETLQRAYSLDPQTVKLVWAIAETYRAMRDYEQADRYYVQAISLAPDQAVYWEERALNRLAWTGDLAAARGVLKEAPIPGDGGLAAANFQLDLYAREYQLALGRLSPERLQALAPQVQSRIVTLASLARERAGDPQGALAAAETNYSTLLARVARFPRESFYRAYLAVALAQLGRREEALATAEQAVRQRQHDAFTGPRMVEIQAIVDVVLGRRREAVDRLARLLAMPYQAPVTPADLRLSPIWDPLRGDPGFEDLLRRHED
jgi:TolB-like protein/tetratricopeptide (TPR) repeat protein